VSTRPTGCEQTRRCTDGEYFNPN